MKSAGRKAGDILKALILRGTGDSDCWLWLGKVSKVTGYGMKQWHGRTVLAHRWVFQIFNGWIPEHKVINHLCSNRKCVNPDHLEVTTATGNCRHGNGTKLSVDDVRCIKSRLKVAKWGERGQLATQYGVSPGLISDIKYGRAWRDIE